ncbi:CBS domain-containing protein [Candidatus Parcubacteria bacterium]|nr:CBS domain-containing protein [Candidatus Parcubacteria bacterium]
MGVLLKFISIITFFAWGVEKSYNTSMWGQVLTILLFTISALAVSLRKYYLQSPVIEPPARQANPALKRRTVKSTKREHVLSALLIIIAVICFSLFAAILPAYVPKIVYFAILALGVYFVFFYLPGKNSGRFITDLAGLLTPLFIALLSKTKNQTKSLEKRLAEREKSKNVYRHLTKTEILEMLNRQKANYDGRSLAKGLNFAINSINLGGKQIEDYTMPLADVHLVGAQETAGPILIDELHKSGYRIFPVNNKNEGIIGTVRLSDLIDLSEGGRAIKDVMNNDLQYLDEDDSVMAAFDKFVNYGTTMFIVKAGNKDSGILYLEDLTSELIEE